MEETESKDVQESSDEGFSINLNDKVDINVMQLLLLLVECEEEAMRHVYYDDETHEMGSTADTMVIARRNLIEFMQRRHKAEDGDGKEESGDAQG